MPGRNKDSYDIKNFKTFNAHSYELIVKLSCEMTETLVPEFLQFLDYE